MTASAAEPSPLAADNPKVKLTRRLARSRRARADQGRFVVEGPGLIIDADRAGCAIHWVFVPDDTDPAAAAAMGDHLIHRLTRSLFDDLCTTQTPQPALAVVDAPDLPVDLGAGLVLALAAVADPGNAGTLMRAAEAAGAAGVVMLPESVDPLNPKTVRSSAGSVFRLGVEAMDPAQLHDRADRAGATTWAAVAEGGVSHRDADLTGSTVIVLGNEAHGIDDRVRTDRTLSIAMAGGPQSLNVAMAGTVLAFEAHRQRNGRGSGGSVA